jgi:large subunit ribosomal protein L25
LPKDLPEIIRVDVSALQLNESLHVRDLPKIAGVTYQADPELTVFLVSEPKTVDETTPAEGGATEPEVINEKKPAEGEAKDEAKKD